MFRPSPVPAGAASVSVVGETVVAASPVLGMPLAWGLLGFIAYPVMVALGWVFVRRAEANERTFVDMVAEPELSERLDRFDRGGGG